MKVHPGFNFFSTIELNYTSEMKLKHHWNFMLKYILEIKRTSQRGERNVSSINI